MTKILSLRISFMVVFAIATLLMVALFVVFCFSRKAMKDEAQNKASQTVEATVQQVDNILLSVEQAAGNMYWDMLLHIDDPDRMFIYSRKLVETSPYITGAAIAFKPYFYQERGELFMAYSHSTGSGLSDTDSAIVQSDIFGSSPYTGQPWYTDVIKTGMPAWITYKQGDEDDGEPIITFSLPIYNRTGVIGVMGVDVSLNLLSHIVLSAKPSPNSYALLLDDEGYVIIHPDREKLTHHSFFTTEQGDGNDKGTEIAHAMMRGESGYRQCKIDHTPSYVFYKPFNRYQIPGRTTQKLGWSIGIVYPEKDIFGDYNRLLGIVLGIVIVSLILLMGFCLMFTHRQLLPLRLLTKSAQRITDGYYYDTIPDTRQRDEVGQLQKHFQKMQKALAAHIGELERLNTSLKERGEVLGKAYQQAKEAERVKTAFLHNMTNQMSEPVNIITEKVALLSEARQDARTANEVGQMVDSIDKEGKKITELLNDLLKLSLENPETETNQKQPSA